MLMQALTVTSLILSSASSVPDLSPHSHIVSCLLTSHTPGLCQCCALSQHIDSLLVSACMRHASSCQVVSFCSPEHAADELGPALPAELSSWVGTKRPASSDAASDAAKRGRREAGGQWHLSRAPCVTDCMHEQLLACNTCKSNNYSCRSGVEVRQHSFA